MGRTKTTARIGHGGKVTRNASKAARTSEPVTGGIKRGPGRIRGAGGQGGTKLVDSSASSASPSPQAASNRGIKRKRSPGPPFLDLSGGPAATSTPVTEPSLVDDDSDDDDSFGPQPSNDPAGAAVGQGGTKLVDTSASSASPSPGGPAATSTPVTKPSLVDDDSDDDDSFGPQPSNDPAGAAGGQGGTKLVDSSASSASPSPQAASNRGIKRKRSPGPPFLDLSGGPAATSTPVTEPSLVDDDSDDDDSFGPQPSNDPAGAAVA